jgi:hypothetical protein
MLILKFLVIKKMNILKQISLYTSHSVDNFVDSNNNLMNDLDAMERIIKSMDSESKRKLMLKNLDMIRSFLMDNMDIYMKGEN